MAVKGFESFPLAAEGIRMRGNADSLFKARDKCPIALQHSCGLYSKLNVV